MDTERIARLERLMAAHGTDIIRLCALQLGDKDQAEDAAQDTFVKAWRALPRFKGECSEKTWLFRIAINTCRDYQRTGWFRHMDRRLTPEELSIPADAPQVDMGLLDRVHRLPAREREVIVMHYWNDMPPEEIAALLHIDRATVFRRLQRGRRRLKIELEGGDGA